MLTLGSRLLALGFVAALAALLAHYPPGALWPAAALAAYAALLWIRPALWLFAVPALLPVLDFSAWTGWFYVREADFLVLATLAVGYWRLVSQRAAFALPAAATGLIALLGCSYAISAFLGLGGFPAVDANSFASYQSPFNSLRILLGFAWAVLLLPLLTRSLGDGADNVRRLFFPGMLTGLGLAGLAVLWERVAFAGLMDFAGEYRVTGSFSDTHTGGAALDGYLMLALPFAAVWALQARNPARIAAASLALVLGSYAALVTFSRSTQFAYAFAMAVVLAFLLHRPRSGTAHSTARMLTAAVLLLLLAYVLVRVFTTGGYRTLAAALGMLAAAFFAGTADFRGGSGRAVAVAAVLLCGATVALAAWSPRSIYLSYAAALTLLAAGLLAFRFNRDRGPGSTMALTSFPWLCLGTVSIAWHWGGAAAAPDALLAVATALCLIGYNRFADRPLWSLNKANVAAAGLVALVLALTIPVTGAYFMQSRFATVDRDIAGRFAHWRYVLAMIDPGWVAGAFGMGLGSFPRNYFWGNGGGEIPGSQVYRHEGANTLLRLGGPRAGIGGGEALIAFQMIGIEPGRNYRLSFDLRGNAKDAVLYASICEKWLLYPVACVGVPGITGAGIGEWKRFEANVSSGALGRMHWFGKRPVQLDIAVEKPGSFVEIDNIALLDDAGRDLIRNGDFSRANDWWYFSSDHIHLPWHAKNLQLHVLFEQGWLGLALMSLLVVYALREFARRALRGDLLAAAPLAAVAGFLVVGLIDSLLDFPRLTLLFYLLLFLSMLPEPKPLPP